jgi:hypothetical protein
VATSHPLPITRGLTVAFVLSALAGALLVVTSVTGLMFGTRGLYRPDPGTLPTFIGQDLITLIVALPILLVTLWYLHRGSLRALLLWPGVLVYVAYSYAYYLISPEFNTLLERVRQARLHPGSRSILARLSRMTLGDP